MDRQGARISGKENAYFQAAEAIGARTLRTLVRHVLPNIAAPPRRLASRPSAPLLMALRPI